MRALILLLTFSFMVYPNIRAGKIDRQSVVG